jgi:uronate dehydrogenase
MKRVLLTGAAGDIGGRLRKLLKPVYPELRLSDIKKPADLRPDEPFIAADLARIEEVEKAVDGIEGIIHLGGHSVEGPWDILQPICSAATICSRRRAAGRRARDLRPPICHRLSPLSPFRRRRHRALDSRYGVSKALARRWLALLTRRPARVPQDRQRRRHAA